MQLEHIDIQEDEPIRCNSSNQLQLEHIDIQEDEPIPRSDSLESVQEEEGLDGHVAQFKSSGDRPTQDPAKAMTGTYTADSIGNFPFWNWGFPDVFVTPLDPQK